MRKGMSLVWRLFLLAGLMISAGAWVLVATNTGAAPNICASYALGYASCETWGVTVVVRPDGYVLGQYFKPYLGHRNGLWGHWSRSSQSNLHDKRWYAPWIQQGPIAVEFAFHLGVPILVFAVAAGHTWLVPIARRYRRRRAGRCLACGYDLTGNPSGTCPECGTMFDKNKAPADTPHNDAEPPEPRHAP